jgi:SAM-dependent methyltransferase
VSESSKRAPSRDSLEHAALVRRILRIDEAVWSHVLEEYQRRLTDDTPTGRLRALREAWKAFSPHAAPPLAGPASPCPACGGATIQPEIHRRSGEIYGLCTRCGHGLLLSRAACAGIYRRPEYYSQRTVDGVGYDAYRQGKDYREAKAARVLAWIEQTVGAAGGRRLLEVGSGFGYTRAAAGQRGWRSMGVDLNPRAAAAARELYSFETIIGTLEEALSSGAISRGHWNLVLYQFVLEHVADPVRELKHAAAAAAPGGHIALLVPSMQAVERIVFGASYRSFRPDHLHLFSWASLDRCLAAGGWVRVAGTSECSVHLLAGFLNQHEIEEIYGRGDGPDLLVVAQVSEDL